jgi:hypothetical protein
LSRFFIYSVVEYKIDKWPLGEGKLFFPNKIGHIAKTLDVSSGESIFSLAEGPFIVFFLYKKLMS